MTTTFGQDLIGSLTEALDHAKKKKVGAREHIVEVPDVRSLSASKTATPDASRRIGSDLERVDKHVIQPEEYEEIPELTDGFFDRAELRIGDKLIRPGRPPLADGQRKEAVNIRLSPEVLAAFRKAGRVWQTRIDQALRQWLKEHPESDAA